MVAKSTRSQSMQESRSLYLSALWLRPKPAVPGPCRFRTRLRPITRDLYRRCQRGKRPSGRRLTTSSQYAGTATLPCMLKEWMVACARSGTHSLGQGVPELLRLRPPTPALSVAAAISTSVTFPPKLLIVASILSDLARFTSRLYVDGSLHCVIPVALASSLTVVVANPADGEFLWPSTPERAITNSVTFRSERR